MGTNEQDFGENSVKPVRGSGYVDLGFGRRCARRLKGSYSLSSLYALDLELHYEDGRMVFRSLTFRSYDDGPAVTSDGIRQMPLADIVSGVITDAIETAPGAPNVDTPSMRRHPSQRAPRATTDELLQGIAYHYRIATISGQHPTVEVMFLYEMTRPTASRWIARARAAGYLGAATVGKAGEMEA
jgi:hypothetical protein